jgi:hypothetical protein
MVMALGIMATKEDAEKFSAEVMMALEPLVNEINLQLFGGRIQILPPEDALPQ